MGRGISGQRIPGVNLQKEIFEEYEEEKLEDEFDFAGSAAGIGRIFGNRRKDGSCGFIDEVLSLYDA